MILKTYFSVSPSIYHIYITYSIIVQVYTTTDKMTQDLEAFT